MSRQNFNLLISFLQVFGILLVVIGHSFYGASKDNFIITWIYSFHMPLFMFISGYLFAYTMKLKGKSLYTMSWEECGKFIVKKIRRLMIPYVAISSLAFFPKALMSTFASRPVEVSFSGYLEMLAYPWDNVIIFFWFLPTLFLIFCITVFGAYSLRRLRLGFPPPWFA